MRDMTTGLQSFTSAATKLARNPLGIIALFIVLVYGIAALALNATTSSNAERLPLVWFLVIFPVLVLGVFTWLVIAHSDKIYAPTDFRSDEEYRKSVKMRLQAGSLKAARAAANLSIATAQSPSGRQGIDKDGIDQIVDAVQTAMQSPSDGSIDWDDQILWVDDRPRANANERRAFEAYGIHFSQAVNTQQALDLLNGENFIAIISDMARAEGEQEGLVLIDEVRKFDRKTPIFIYSTPKSDPEIAEIKRRGAQAVVTDPRDLFKTVVDFVTEKRSEKLMAALAR
jgi:CheY-like chemotaxis protein